MLDRRALARALSAVGLVLRQAGQGAALQRTMAMLATTTSTNVAGPSSPPSLEQDRRGYPARQYRTRILPIRSSALRFSGKGKEPVRDVDVVVAGEGSEQDADNLALASSALKSAHLVAFPTETVYGLAGNALDGDAAAKIFAAKGRPADNPLIVHISDLAMLDSLVPQRFQLSPVYDLLIRAFWPGPLTLLLPADQERVPSAVRCGLDTIGVRMPSHPVARALIARSGLPLAAPSANVSGRPSPTTARHVYRDMTKSHVPGGGDTPLGRIPFIIDGGPSDVGLESTVVDGVTDPSELRILRPGGVGVEAIERALSAERLLRNGKDNDESKRSEPGAVYVRVYGKDIAKSASVERNPTTPGMKYRHYSPDAEVVLLITTKVQQGESLRNVLKQADGAAPAESGSAVDARDAVMKHVAMCQGGRRKHDLHVGLMSMDDSPLTQTLLRGATRSVDDARLWQPMECGLPRQSQEEDTHPRIFTLHGFSLGTTAAPAEAAHRLFDGLRTLDEGRELPQGSPSGPAPTRCDIIFVEAPADDAGVGLAIMNRIQKAASTTLLVNV